jgi:hypothetical protein
MTKFAVAVLCAIALISATSAQQQSFYDLKTTSLDGKPADLAQYKGKGQPGRERCQPVRLYASVRRS